jgi:toxin ParE1/3/4
MAKYHLTKKAVEDLAEIYRYSFEEWSEKQAEKYYLMLLSSCQEIAENPDLGKKYDIVTENLLGYKSNEHLIFYLKLSNTEIEVIRILHGSMDLKNKI